MNKFPPDNVDKLLKRREGEYKSAPLNLFEPVFAAAICAKISDVPTFELAADEAKVRVFLSEELPPDLPVRIAEETLDELEIFGETRDYALKAAPKIFRLLSAAKGNEIKGNGTKSFGTKDNETKSNGTLGRMFLPRQNTAFGFGSVTLSYGERMSGEKYSALLSEFANAENAETKKKLITENIVSFADLFEVVVDVDFAAEELAEIFSALPFEVVAGLIRRFASAELSTDKKERNVFFALAEFEKSLPDDKKRSLAAMSEKIEFEPF